MNSLASRRLALCAIAAMAIDCGGRSDVWFEMVGGNGGSDGAGGAPASSGGSPSEPSSGGAMIPSGGSSGGTMPTSGGAPTLAGGAPPAAGGAMDGSGGAFEAEESFTFLGNEWEVFDSNAFGTHLYTLSQYLPGQDPYHFYSFPPDITFYSASAPRSENSDFLLGYSTWVVGENQFLRSFDPLDDKEVDHGLWGISPGGFLESRVDGAAKLNEEVLIVAVWNDVLGQGELWLVGDPAALAVDQQQLKESSGKLIYESPDAPLDFHGITSENEALLSDGHDVLVVDEGGQLSVFEGPDDEFVAAEGPLFADALLTIGTTGGVSRIRVFAGHWWEANIDPGIVPESVTWLGATTILYESTDGLVRWDPYVEMGGTFHEPTLVEEGFSGFVPRGQAIQWEDGVALRAQSMEGWAVAFVGGDSIDFCVHPNASIGRLAPHVLNGVSGALFDEVDPMDSTRFGRIYFCALGQEPVDLLSEHAIFGRLIPP